MLDFNRSDRTALLIGGALMLLATVVRTALEPSGDAGAWYPSSADRQAATIDQVTDAVSSALAVEDSASRPLAPGERLDLNTATEATLRRLPGIGPARAAEIVRYRLTNGPFNSPEGLTAVPGIGVAMVERLKPHLVGTSRGFPRPGNRIDLNRAQIKDLEQITGIGPVLAARIVAARNARTRFQSIDELADIPGIGPATVEKLRNSLYVR